jgi:hypothetical protein
LAEGVEKHATEGEYLDIKGEESEGKLEVIA